MTIPRWRITGPYVEACSCDYLCPCIIGIPQPTQGYCQFTSLYHIGSGWYEQTTLDDLSVVVVGWTPEAMEKGNWALGIIIDERASPDQARALGAIFRGEEGGPMAAMKSLVTTFLGVATRSIEFHVDGKSGSFSVPAELDLAVEGIGEIALRYLDTPGHPGGDRLALARASRNSVHAFGIDWEGMALKSNGHLATFLWQSTDD